MHLYIWINNVEARVCIHASVACTCALCSQKADHMTCTDPHHMTSRGRNMCFDFSYNTICHLGTTERVAQKKAEYGKREASMPSEKRLNRPLLLHLVARPFTDTHIFAHAYDTCLHTHVHMCSEHSVYVCIEIGWLSHVSNWRSINSLVATSPSFYSW